jgi:hypothetical protein
MTRRNENAVLRAVRFLSVIRFFKSINLRREHQYRWYEVERRGV